MNLSSLSTLENFDCEGEISSVALRWRKWKRALNIYLEAASIDSPAKKRAVLLHMGGIGIQEIYYNIPGAHVETSVDVDIYEVAVQKLDEYFAPKQSKVFERHIFRLLKQDQGEKFERFLIRLRHQAEKCQFQNLEENLIDQIVEKGCNLELRKKILAVGDSMTLEMIINEANSLESVTRQLGEFSGNPDTLTQDINLLQHKPSGSRREEEFCRRCGSTKHSSTSLNCPAVNQECGKCGFKGHFMSQCRTAPGKRKNKRLNVIPQKRQSKFKKAKMSNAHAIEENSEDEGDYVFHIDQDDTLSCKIGGVNIDMLIDSGSKCNLLSLDAWQYLKRERVQVHNQVKNPDKIFLAYASKAPLTVVGSFEAFIDVGNQPIKAVFYVIKNGNKNLLGKRTAIELGVLKIGLHNVNATTSPFPKFKDTVVDIPIDETIQPVSQPYRRVPIPLEEKINRKLKELIDLDIIEEVAGSSKWVSPIVPVLKDNGEVRICLDMRRANSAIMRENHPLPTMDQLLPKFRGAKIFSKLDIKNAFHQIEISPASRHITTFISSKGLLRYKRLMFGISCAPEIFQKLLERVLAKCDGVVNFIDDILIFGATLEEHNMRLNNVLTTLDQNNILLNKDKCMFRLRSVEF
ncbi:uncharacterized protein K02A2.6-like [Sitophilus oryzae]|uniref:Uncharacterized protein K02A2.6-like n=1 Tax=Sitophilus oryzae TaxID=7048 RepID=A0A6J2YWG0_SITOR|nr:uncharacterized protein K02A2.6-like [Sitophilus oryzae]